jgi:hypothetical protein
MSKVTDIGKEKVFTQEQELSDRINDLISDYNSDLSIVSVMGILALKLIDLRENQQ